MAGFLSSSNIPHGVVGSICSEVRDLSVQLSKPIEPFPIQSLPYGLLFQIRNKMPASSQVNLARTCKSMLDLVERYFEQAEEVSLVLKLFEFYEGKQIFRDERTNCRLAVKFQKLDSEKESIQVIARSILLFTRFSCSTTLAWLNVLTSLPGCKEVYDGLIAFSNHWLQKLRDRDEESVKELVFARGLQNEYDHAMETYAMVEAGYASMIGRFNEPVFLSALSRELAFGEDMVDDIIEHIISQKFN